jgi:hypothetical protein
LQPSFEEIENIEPVQAVEPMNVQVLTYLEWLEKYQGKAAVAENRRRKRRRDLPPYKDPEDYMDTDMFGVESLEDKKVVTFADALSAAAN